MHARQAFALPSPANNKTKQYTPTQQAGSKHGCSGSSARLTEEARARVIVGQRRGQRNVREDSVDRCPHAQLRHNRHARGRAGVSQLPVPVPPHLPRSTRGHPHTSFTRAPLTSVLSRISAGSIIIAGAGGGSAARAPPCDMAKQPYRVRRPIFHRPAVCVRAAVCPGRCVRVLRDNMCARERVCMCVCVCAYLCVCVCL